MTRDYIINTHYDFSEYKKLPFWHISPYLGKDSDSIHSYSLSAVGKPCNNPIKSESRCRKAAEVLKLNDRAGGIGEIETHFLQSSDNGYDLPKGCISEVICFISEDDHIPCRQVPRFVYWNPNGIAISNDIRIRTVCYNPPNSYDGKTNLFRNSR